MIDSSKPFFLQALDALKLGDRRGAAVLLGRELREGNTAQKNLPSVAQLAAHIGEIDLCIEATRRWSPGTIDSLLGYWAVLGNYGRSSEALADVERQPASVREHPSVLHVRGNILAQFGRVKEARQFFRRAIARNPQAMESWFALAMIKKFKPGDADLAAMERLEQSTGGLPEARASLLYGIGKAREDCGDVDRAFEAYSKGAAICRSRMPFDVAGYCAAVERVLREFTPENLQRLRPSEFKGQRSLFVTGLPRSGTTLTEQILVGHSKVADGAELNLFDPAVIPLLGVNLDNAMRYQQSRQSDPWGEIARDYASLVDMRFGSSSLVVDKSLGQSLLIALMLHSIPDARIAWLRRRADDVALSCFRTYFPAGLSWTCSLTDMADYMRAEDRLFSHWRSIFPERILVVPYEELVRTPAAWSERLQSHFGLPFERDLDAVDRTERAINTASVTQVTQPISTSRIGQAAAFERHLKPFRDRYYS